MESLQDSIYKMLSSLGIYALGATRRLDRFMLETLCNDVPLACKLATRELSTNDLSLVDQESFDVMVGHFPAGSSINVLKQYVQEKRAGYP